MRTEFGKIERTPRPVGGTLDFADADHAPEHIAPHLGAPSTKAARGSVPPRRPRALPGWKWIWMSYSFRMRSCQATPSL